MQHWVIVTLAVFNLAAAALGQTSRRSFWISGKDFIFRVVQDSYQFEGSLGADGAGQSNLDLWCQWNLGQPNNGGWELCGTEGAGFYWAHGR